MKKNRFLLLIIAAAMFGMNVVANATTFLVDKVVPQGTIYATAYGETVPLDPFIVTGPDGALRLMPLNWNSAVFLENNNSSFKLDSADWPQIFSSLKLAERFQFLRDQYSTQDLAAIQDAIYRLDGFSVLTNSSVQIAGDTLYHTAPYFAPSANGPWLTVEGVPGIDFVRVPMVPESSTWAMMLFGFGVMGLQFFRRHRRSVVV